jgi:hypothetical protein
MLKIIIAFDGQHFAEGALSMARWLNGRNPVLVTGIFLSPVDYREIIGYSGMGMGAPVFTMPIDTDDVQVNETMQKFSEYCTRHQLEYTMHKDTDLFAIGELIQETRFADCLIISSELFYENINKDQPNEYLRKTLHESECPVLLVPEKFNVPESVLLSYDGKSSSVYAIKQFAYLFPDCCNLGTLMFNSGDDKNIMPYEDLIEELVARHYQPITIEKLAVDSKDQMTSWMSDKTNAILVSGAFGRGELSNLLKKSFVTDVIKEHRIPVFVAHK